jgi:folate-binding protein YgfZ
MNGPTPRAAWMAEYDALVTRAALVDLGRRTQIELTGPDRAAFLHNLTTNEIRKLAPGSGCEAFLTTVQGKTLAHGFFFAGDEALVIDTVPGQSETILKHLDHYLVSERVTIEDRSHQWSELLLSGPEAERLLSNLSDVHLAPVRLAHAPATLAGKSVWLRRADLTGPIGVLISVQDRVNDSDLQKVRSVLIDGGAVACGEPAFEAARIEWGFPLFGRDLSDQNLPQEIARDSVAISFTKGCYLGQETVARIDALGHVNKTLVGLQFAGPAIPPAGTPLSNAGQAVGQVTSAAFSPRLGRAMALGYVRRGPNAPGTRLSSPAGEAEVVALPQN